MSARTGGKPPARVSQAGKAQEPRRRQRRRDEPEEIRHGDDGTRDVTGAPTGVAREDDASLESLDVEYVQRHEEPDDDRLITC